MARYGTVLRARRLVTNGREEAGCVGVADGRIAAVAPPEADLDGRRVVELGDDVPTTVPTAPGAPHAP